MTVAILMPTHNRAQFIGEAIESCLAQTDADWELYIWDDGSTDGTQDLVCRHRDHRIRYRWSPKRPANEPGVRNDLLKWWDTYAATLACWLDSDDVMHKDRVKSQREFMDNHPDLDVCYSGLWMVDSKIIEVLRAGLWLEPDPLIPDVSRYGSDLRTYKGNMATPTGMLRPAVRPVAWDENVRHGGSDLLWLFTLVQQGYRVGVVPRVLYYLRMHGDRLTRKRDHLPAEVVQRDLDHFYAEIARMGGTW